MDKTDQAIAPMDSSNFGEKLHPHLPETLYTVFCIQLDKTICLSGL